MLALGRRLCIPPEPELRGPLTNELLSLLLVKMPLTKSNDNDAQKHHQDVMVTNIRQKTNEITQRP